MKTEFHPTSERGHATHGWLDSYHSFSFADYFNPMRDRFGALRVLNDDTIMGGTGFGEHPHDNMEIISIPLDGELEHRDSMGHTEVIRPGEVQVMSAGTGIRHSEYNHSQSNVAKFLQIWIYTRTRNLTPRYDQKAFDITKRINSIQCIVSPDNQTEEGALIIYQDAWISIAKLDSGKTLHYKLFKKGNIAFVFIIEGSTTISGQAAGRRDAVGVRETETIELISLSESEILIVEVPEK